MFTSRSNFGLGVLTRVAVVSALLIAGLGATAASADEAVVERLEGPFETAVGVAEADNPAGFELMFAECDFVQRVTRPNGTATETQHCQITGPYVDFPGAIPDSAYVASGGDCLWASDYFLTMTGEVVVAESVTQIVTPSGRVNVTATYGPNPTPVEEC